MRENVTADGLAAIRSGEQSAGARVTLHLVRQEDGNVELFCHFCQHVQVNVELLLALAELAATMIVDAE